MKHVLVLHSVLVGLVLLGALPQHTEKDGTAPHPLLRLAAEGTVTQRFFFAGEWHEETARVRRSTVLAGNYVEEVLLDARGEETARRFFGWDAGTNTLTGVWMDGRGGRPALASGPGRGPSRTLTGEEDFGAGLVPVRWTLTEDGARRTLEARDAASGSFETILEELHAR